MREDADFDGYLAARWPALVRTLVLLGCPEEIAPDVALDGVARCRADWSATRTSGDVDVVVHRCLLEAWEERQSTPWWKDLSPDADAEGPLSPELVGSLDRLTRDVRTVLVLERHGGLGRGQSSDAAGVQQVAELPVTPSTDELRFALEHVGVLAPPAPEAVVQRERERRRRRRRVAVTRAIAVVAPVVLVAGLTWWLLQDGPADEALADVAVDRVENPAAVAWYADGRLHLADVVLDVPAVRQFEPVADGAAYGDEQGRVVFVDDDGSRTILGKKDPASPLVVSDERGWVVWVEGEAGSARLVVHELASSGTLAARDVVPPEQVDDPRFTFDTEPKAIAVEGGIVYYDDGADAHAWNVVSGEEMDLGWTRLLDANARTWVSQPMPGVINIAAAYTPTGFTVPGAGAQLSADAELVLTRDTSEQDSFGPVLIYDTETGADLSFGLGPEDVALAAALGPGQTVTYIVARAEDRPENADYLRSSFSGQLELRTCDIGTRECQSLDRFPSTKSRPLLAY